jgi:hypothetical protein
VRPVLLRRPKLPADVPSSDRALVRGSGPGVRAQLDRHTDEAVRLFAALVEKRPRERYLHYGYGLALAQAGSAESLVQFRREIELFPDDVLARVELAFALLARGGSRRRSLRPKRRRSSPPGSSSRTSSSAAPSWRPASSRATSASSKPRRP